MKKGQRPSKHYRKIKTRKGRKKILVNKDVKNKIMRKRHSMLSRGTLSTTILQARRLTDKDIIRVPSPWEIEKMNSEREKAGLSLLTYDDVVEEAKKKRKEYESRKEKEDQIVKSTPSFFELERKAKQQNDMNLYNDIKSLNNLKKELAKPIYEERKQEYQIGVAAHKKLSELNYLKNILEKKRKDETRFEEFEKRDIGRKIIEASILARDSNDPKLMKRALDVTKGYKKLFESNPEALKEMYHESQFVRQKTSDEIIKDLNKESKKIIKEMDPTKIEVISDDARKENRKNAEREILRELGRVQTEMIRARGLSVSEAKKLAEQVVELKKKLAGYDKYER